MSNISCWTTCAGAIAFSQSDLKKSSKKKKKNQKLQRAPKDNCFYHILGSDYAEFARRHICDVTITHISTPCKKCISLSVRVQKNAYQ
jgi:hypothetical protein